MTFSHFLAWIKLGRYQFLGGGFVFFALGAAIVYHQGVKIDWSRYVLGQLIVTLTQLMVHYSNDYFDYQADVANKTPIRWSGGSRILPSGQLPPNIALYTALGLGLIVISLSFFMANVESVSMLTIGLLALAVALSWNYSGPPLRLHSRGLGEITAAIVVLVLTPLVGYSFQTGHIDPLVLLAVIPVALLQFNMLLAVHLPDMEGDASVGKRTLVVILGRKRTTQLYQSVLAIAYLFVPMLILAGLPLEVGIAICFPLPLAMCLLWRFQIGHGLMLHQWDKLAFWTIGLLMGTGVLQTIAFIFIR